VRVVTPPEKAAREPRRLALVLWHGYLGGAETFTVALARALREKGADAQIVFVGDPASLTHRVHAAAVPFETLGLSRGRSVLRHPRKLARTVTHAGADGAILVEGGYLGAALRLGGYRGKIVAVEHGAILMTQRMQTHRQLVHRLSRLSGERAIDVHVAVSDYVFRRIQGSRRPVVTISNGIDLTMYRPPSHERRSRDLVIGCMARLVPGKGVDDLLCASAQLQDPHIQLRIAGGGPERPQLEAFAARLGVSQHTEFLGWVSDTSAFWRSCDVAVVPSSQWIESFGLTAAEAMASGRPVIATRNGGLSEVVADDITGFIVPANDPRAIAASLRRYLDDRRLADAHGAAARRRCEERFDVRRCADSYLALFNTRNEPETAELARAHG
jgi:glycosyltransferase involved in cell wall biosynthesis